MGLATKRQRITSNLPKTFSTFRAGPWLFVQKSRFSAVLNSGANIFAMKITSWIEAVRDAPLRRFLNDLHQLGPVLLPAYVLLNILSSFQSALNLHYTNKLLSALETSLSSGQPDKNQTMTAAGMCIFMTIVIGCCQWILNVLQPMCLQRIKLHFRKRVIEAQMRQDLLSSEVNSDVLNHDTHDIATNVLHGLISICNTTASTASQVTVILQILRGREGSLNIIFACLAKPIFSSLMQRSMWDITAVYWVHDEWNLRARTLCDIVFGSFYRQEVLGGGMGKYLMQEFTNATNHNVDIDENVYSAYSKLETPFSSIGALLLEDLPLLYLAFSSVLHPQKFSISSLAILSRTSSVMRSAWEDIYEYNNSIFGHFIDLKRLYVALDLNTTFEAGSMPYPTSKTGQQGMGISLDDVTFFYPGRDEAEKPRAALKNVSFSFPPSSMVVIVGENGSGKSSLVNILAGLYSPSSGTVLIDGVNAKEYKMEDLTNVTALLTQEHAIFPLDVAESIGIGDFDHVNDMKRIEEAAELGGAKAFIEKLEYGFDEVLEPIYTAGSTRYDDSASDLMKIMHDVDRNAAVSGGEKQRLAAARTFMRLTSGRIKLLVVDEPTSAMDPAGEFELFERLRAMRSGKTVIFVTHRFGHLTKHADIILCMKDGEVAESGTHRELMDKKGEYHRLYDIQAQAFIDT